MDELDEATIAEIDGLEPKYPVPEQWGMQTAEALDYTFHALGLDAICTSAWVPGTPLTPEIAAVWSERAALLLADWLRDHGVPQIELWYPSAIAGDWVKFRASASAPDLAAKTGTFLLGPSVKVLTERTINGSLLVTVGDEPALLALGTAVGRLVRDWRFPGKS